MGSVSYFTLIQFISICFLHNHNRRPWGNRFFKADMENWGIQAKGAPGKYNLACIEYYAGTFWGDLLV
jgi:hypothetical protein